MLQSDFISFTLLIYVPCLKVLNHSFCSLLNVYMCAQHNVMHTMLSNSSSSTSVLHVHVSINFAIITLLLHFASFPPLAMQ